ncbi:MAG: TonB-dependent receptor [gamma proteobacterium symbiont of Bathyaustriella thionipta]|nr:TonB-dependent receptor [gamma proteobacterium symbiont of Bathyaustriella thionipta]MCU7950393.1 TonB-dependent receptor [gamma proteobacterium symbiont of Bathyaustriella thionipta]MCU7953496.1 TonB-dependent receptor [gamma proteobacterium symbiont of Bathyaustriella thionipta]MCU7956893.1 TonB-dependent receptor [gamma proteobacterium symbiont of Bathyaustriella thionipta]MCU7966537.1 TonB-dependent receptor [gamma proteobacterium symbiont of Bathyaustriella thionipta]
MIFKKQLQLRLLILLFVSSCSFSQAESVDDYTEMSLQELMSLKIFTAASLLPTEQKKAPGTVYSFNRDDFEHLGVRRLDELLEYVPGFQLNQYRKRHQSIWARGMIDRYNDKMKLIVDGVPIQHVYYGHFSAGENLALEKIGKVEVIIGPVSSLYGANAFAGVISVTTREFTNKTEQAVIETGLELGNHDRAKGTVFYNSEKLQGFVSYLDQDAPFDTDRKSFIGGSVSQPLDERYKNLYLKAKPAKGLQLTLDYQYNETPFVFFPSNSPVNTKDNTEETMYNLSARYEYGDLDEGKLEATAYYVDDQATEEVYMQDTGQKAYEENRDSIYYGIKATWFKKYLSDHTIALGGEWQHDEAKDMDTIERWNYRDLFLVSPQMGSLLTDKNEENDDYAVFVQDVWEINHTLTTTISARYDVFDQFENDANYRLAMVYTPTEQQTIKMLWGTAVRKPTYREYLKVLENTSFIPAIPETEKMETFELGYAYQWQDANISVTSFYNEFDDYLHEVATPDGSDEYFINSDNTWRMYGVEILSVYQLNSQLNFRATLGWLKAGVDLVVTTAIPDQIIFS